MKTKKIPIHKKRKKIDFLYLIFLYFFIFLLQNFEPDYVTGQTALTQRELVPPAWAPQYDNVQQILYYYIPDAEAYFDVKNHEFIYLYNGNWVRTTYPPDYFSDFDINKAFVVVLNSHAQEPWQQHQLYISHYPRYYYKSIYNEEANKTSLNDTKTRNNKNISNDTIKNNVQYVCGFNENKKSAIYNHFQKQNKKLVYNANREGVNPSPIRNETSTTNVQTNHGTTSAHQNDTVRNERTTRQENKNASTEPAKNERQNDSHQLNTPKQQNTKNNIKKTKEPRKFQPVVYNGKKVGKPVRVKRKHTSPKKEVNGNIK